MKVIKSIAELKPVVAKHKGQQSIGFVPTMGNLHQGHIDLVNCAREKTDLVIVSIFVNPMQFSAGEDLDKYPRTLEADIEKLTEAGADVLFVPDVNEIYGEGLDKSTRVVVPGISELWCGDSRPGHFDGVTTVVNKLFNLIQPDMAVFGKKDFQQLTIIKKMVRDLNMPVEVVGVATRREADGLAMSSRNGYLSAAERKIAPTLQQVLQQIKSQVFETVDLSFDQITEEAISRLESAGFKTDYLAICRQSDLQVATEADDKLVVVAAAFLGSTRLIDNLTINRC